MGRYGKRGTPRADTSPYEDAAIDSHSARQEAAAASELAKRFLSYL